MTALPRRATRPRGATSVVGEFFEPEAVRTLVDRRVAERLPEVLEALLMKDLVRPSVSGVGATEAVHFRHILLRDTILALAIFERGETLGARSPLVWSVRSGSAPPSSTSSSGTTSSDAIGSERSSDTVTGASS